MEDATPSRYASLVYTLLKALGLSVFKRIRWLIHQKVMRRNSDKAWCRRAAFLLCEHARLLEDKQCARSDKMMPVNRCATVVYLHINTRWLRKVFVLVAFWSKLFRVVYKLRIKKLATRLSCMVFIDKRTSSSAHDIIAMDCWNTENSLVCVKFNP